MAAGTRVELDELGCVHSSLRLVSPSAEYELERSLRAQGQLTPVFVYRVNGALQVIDGFKRLRCARALTWVDLECQELELDSVGAKLQVSHVHRNQGLSEIEEGWIVRDLHRVEGMSQPKIAVALSRSKSWVSRRLLLVEQLHDDVIARLRLGLIAATSARELAALPRGNQSLACQTAIERGLTSRQVAGFVRDLLSAPDDTARERLLATVGKREQAERGPRPKNRSATERLLDAIERTTRWCSKVQALCLGDGLDPGNELSAQHLDAQRESLCEVLRATVQVLSSGRIPEHGGNDGRR